MKPDETQAVSIEVPAPVPEANPAPKKTKTRGKTKKTVKKVAKKATKKKAKQAKPAKKSKKVKPAKKTKQAKSGKRRVGRPKKGQEIKRDPSDIVKVSLYVRAGTVKLFDRLAHKGGIDRNAGMVQLMVERAKSGRAFKAPKK